MSIYRKDILCLLLVFAMLPTSKVAFDIFGENGIAILVTVGLTLAILVGIVVVYLFNNHFHRWCETPLTKKAKQHQNMDNNNTVYTYKGNIYRIVKESRSKHPETREWYDTIVYTRADKTNGDWYVRERTEFFDRFKEVRPNTTNQVI